MDHLKDDQKCPSRAGAARSRVARGCHRRRGARWPSVLRKAGSTSPRWVVIVTTVDVDGSTAVVLIEPDGTMKLGAGKGTQIPGGKTLDQETFGASNDNGQVVFTDQPAIAKTGTDLPGGGKFQQVEDGRRHSAIINNKGQVAALIWIGDNDGGVLVYNIADGTMNVVARTGQDLPGVGKITAMGLSRGVTSWNLGLNDNGDLLFAAQIDGNKEEIILASAQ
jgi:hypothetical protein